MSYKYRLLNRDQRPVPCTDTPEAEHMPDTLLAILMANICVIIYLFTFVKDYILPG